MGMEGECALHPVTAQPVAMTADFFEDRRGQVLSFEEQEELRFVKT